MRKRKRRALGDSPLIRSVGKKNEGGEKKDCAPSGAKSRLAAEDSAYSTSRPWKKTTRRKKEKKDGGGDVLAEKGAPCDPLMLAKGSAANTEYQKGRRFSTKTSPQKKAKRTGRVRGWERESPLSCPGRTCRSYRKGNGAGDVLQKQVPPRITSSVTRRGRQKTPRGKKKRKKKKNFMEV